MSRRRDAAEAEHLRGQFILKIHGCCTRADTLLVTPDQLSDAPLWTKSYFQAELARSSMVFVGIGDVADYAKQRITELADLVEGARIRVVSPDIVSSWEGSEWQSLLPDLPAPRRIGKTADEFLDDLAREWVMTLVAEVKGAPADDPTPCLEAVAGAFVRFTAVQALEWWRRGAPGWKVGESVVRTPAAASTLEAIGILASKALGAAAASQGVAPIRFLPASAVLVDGDRFDVLVCADRQTSAALETAATGRAHQVAQRHGPRDVLHLLVAAGSVRGPKPDKLDAVDVVDPFAPVDDVVAGDRNVAVRLTYVDDVLAAA
jgi:hypothetical protein